MCMGMRGVGEGVLGLVGSVSKGMGKDMGRRSKRVRKMGCLLIISEVGMLIDFFLSVMSYTLIIYKNKQYK